MRRAWWLFFFPGGAAGLAVLSFNLLGDAINDACLYRLYGR